MTRYRCAVVGVDGIVKVSGKIKKMVEKICEHSSIFLEVYGRNLHEHQV